MIRDYVDSFVELDGIVVHHPLLVVNGSRLRCSSAWMFFAPTAQRCRSVVIWFVLVSEFVRSAVNNEQALSGESRCTPLNACASPSYSLSTTVASSDPAAAELHSRCRRIARLLAFLQ